MLLVITGLAMAFLFGCENPSEDPKEESQKAAISYSIRKVAKNLSAIGFPIDLETIDIKVASTEQMASMFSDISRDSLQESQDESAIKKDAFDSTQNFDHSSSRLAFYDPNSKVLFLKKNARYDLDESYLAHELAHVYQDQHYSFEKIWQAYQDNPTRELFNITNFIIEGHAEVVRTVYEQRYPKKEQTRFKGIWSKPWASTCELCDDLESVDEMPYTVGKRFLLHQYSQGGWPLVEASIKSLPSSTEQIIHPEKLASDQPTELSLPTFKGASNAKLLVNGRLGEAFLLTKLLAMKVPKDIAIKTASGWDGDVVQLYRTSNGQDATIWRIIFDREIDAEQLESALLSLAVKSKLIRSGRSFDWIMSKSPLLTKELTAFLKQHSVNDYPNPLDQQSTDAQERSLDGMFGSYPSLMPTVIMR